ELSGFISESMWFIGAFPTFRTIVIFSALGIVIVAAYHLWSLQRVFLGPLNPKYAQLEEINGREIFCLTPLALIVLFLGVWPMPVLDLMSTSMMKLVDVVKLVI
ncbi:MAG: NADH-quinone oxidoreductase subunit M, partial [Deltaproteobacteria bacterium]